MSGARVPAFRATIPDAPDSCDSGLTNDANRHSTVTATELVADDSGLTTSVSSLAGISELIETAAGQWLRSRCALAETTVSALHRLRLIVGELIETEAGYQQSLSEVDSGYLVKLRESGRHNEATLDSIFGVLPHLRTFHK
ncbi:unnamed protein product [Protopolystoma xenopodis]|uniref:DH domain-containing protein n=1 Tax=Protopolystoma xenopodis TaxID=117903 RepID=A0A3S5ARE2_9PLAT|nr:unnamed protein product [Protopolystoma xenopodis]